MSAADRKGSPYKSSARTKRTEKLTKVDRSKTVTAEEDWPKRR